MSFSTRRIAIAGFEEKRSCAIVSQIETAALATKN
jgi:hypothetical protein